jgi:hypothetical protein
MVREAFVNPSRKIFFAAHTTSYETRIDLDAAALFAGWMLRDGRKCKNAAHAHDPVRANEDRSAFSHAF